MSLVSVIIPVYNATRFLHAAMESVLNQTYRDLEVIAVDDGSTDPSGAILAACAARDSRIRVISRQNTGIVGALNDGVAAAHGDLIARMDADDICLPLRLEKQVAYLTDHPECVAVGTDVLYTDPESAPLIRHYPSVHHEGIVEQLLDGNGGALIHPTVMVRRRSLEEAGGYRARYQWIEDLDLYLRLSDRGWLANLPEIHLHYRQHLQSVNYTRRDRDGLRMELLHPRRQALGLPPLAPGPLETQRYRAADWRRHWAYDAARGGNWASARKNARKALAASPFDRRNWQCVRYTMTASSNLGDRAGKVAMTSP